VETLSYGSGGEKAVDTALWLENMLDKIKPDIVITLLGINDLAWNGGPGYQRTDVDTLIQKRNDDEKNKSFLTHAKEMCRNISQLCRRAFVVAKNFSMRRDLQNQKSVEWHSDNMPALRKKYQELPLVDQLTRRPDPIGEFGGAVDWILNFLKKRDKSVIVLGQPVIWKPEMPPEEYKNLWFWMNSSNGPARPSTSWLLQQIQKYNRLQQELAEKYGFSYVDLDAAIPKTLEYYFDDCHYTDKGSARVAEAVLPTLSKVLVAGAPP
jgi:lysophospholipase L1-like esterase